MIGETRLLQELTPGRVFDAPSTGRPLLVTKDRYSVAGTIYIRCVDLADGQTHGFPPTAKVRPADSPLTPADARGLMKWMMRQTPRTEAPRTYMSEEEVQRILWVLGLSPGERAFVQALADEPSDAVTLAVFRDFLFDCQREKDAEGLEADWKGRLLALIQTFGHQKAKARYWESLGYNGDAARERREADIVLAEIKRLIGLPPEEGN